MPSAMIKFFRKLWEKAFFHEKFLVILKTDLNNHGSFR